jgi:hypothetical protein
MSSKILITCPEAEAAVWTGFRAPPGTGLTGLKQVTLKKCPACGSSHLWDASSAYWEEDEAALGSFWANFRSILRRPSHPRA